MDLKTGILVMLVVIAILGMIVSSVGANYVYVHTQNYPNTSHCTGQLTFSPQYYVTMTCNQGSEGSGNANAIDGSGHQQSASNYGMCCVSGKSFKALASSGGYNFVYAKVGCM